MEKIKLNLISGLFLGLVSFSLLADPTILGFEDTLTHAKKARLEQFMAEHKKAGNQKCYYHPGENTVVCESLDGLIYPFR